jgi:Bacterial extracellular solute-binding proteins, family 3/Ligand-gated ion channel
MKATQQIRTQVKSDETIDLDSPNQFGSVFNFITPRILKNSYRLASIRHFSLSGFSVELFRLAAAQNNSIENTDYIFKCVPFTYMIDQLQLVNGTCDVGVGAITISLERQNEGIQFTYPTYSTGLSVLVKATDSRSGGWAWVSPFSLNLWLAVGATVIIFPALLFLIEFGSLKRRIYAQDAIIGMDVATTRALQTLMSSEPLEVSSSGAKVASLVFLFMSLILINTYTANLAAALTVNQINSQITSIDQLRGKAVASNSVYLEKLRSRYGILAITLDNNNPNMLMDAAKQVTSGDLAAVISDRPLIENLLQNISGCPVRQLSDALLEPFNYGFAVKNGINSSFVARLSSSILTLQERGDIQDLAQSFLGFNSRDECGNLNQEDYSIDFYSLYGLWVLLAGALVIGFILMFISRHRRKKKLSAGKKNRSNSTRENGAGGSTNGGNSSPNGRGGQGPLPGRRSMVTLGGISEEAGANDLEEQQQQQQEQDGAVRVVEAVTAQSSLKAKKKSVPAASARWRDVVDNMSALQTRSSIFTSSTWQTRDDIERQQTMEEESSEEE